MPNQLIDDPITREKIVEVVYGLVVDK